MAVDLFAPPDVLGVVVGAADDPVPVARSGATVPNARLIRGVIDLVSRDLVSRDLVSRDLD
jgi:hypothetical protein